MRRKITAIIMALVFSMGVMPVTQADTLIGKINAFKDRHGIDSILTYQTVEVPTEIFVKEHANNTTYDDDSIDITASSATVDLRAKIDMSKVWTAINGEENNPNSGYVNVLNNLINSYGETETEKNDLRTELASAYVDPAIGKSYFTITIDYPNSNFTIPPEFEEKNITDIFSTEDGKDLTKIFELVDIENDSVDTKVTIKVGIKGEGDGEEKVTLSILNDHLRDLELECTGVQIGATGTYTVVGNVVGQTTIKTDVSGELGVVTYDFVPDDVTATVKLSTSSGPSGSVTTKRDLTIVMDNGNVATFRFDKGEVVSLSDLKLEIPNGKMAEFYLDEQLTKVADPNVTLSQDTTIYVKLVDKVDVDIPLEKDDHFAYVIGYPDGNVKPENDITREEIATIFYRLLKDDVRDELFTAENDFTDVDADRWSNKAISTMANGGYIVGYKDGNFKPGAAITRAEFVTIVARFYNVDENTGVKIGDFVDTQGHWASAYIRYSSANGIVNGYEDGTFKPDQNITRAEAMKVINTMLGRAVDEEGLIEEANRWPDNSPDEWYYYHVIEATNPHTYDRNSDGDEMWNEIVENKIINEKAELEDAE